MKRLLQLALALLSLAPLASAQYSVGGIAPSGIGAPIAASDTIAPVAAATHITGTGTVNTMTPPQYCTLGCKLSIITDNSIQFGTSGNFRTSFTSVPGGQYTFFYDPTFIGWFIETGIGGGTALATFNSLVFPGNKVGVNLTSGIGADNGSGDAHYFDFRTVTDLDATSGTPTLAAGVLSSNGSSAFKAVRGFAGGAAQTNSVVQGVLTYGGPSGVNLIGCSGGTAGAVQSTYYAAGFYPGSAPGGFVYYDGTNPHGVVAPGNLTAGAKYIVTFANIGGAGMASIAPLGTTQATTTYSTAASLPACSNLEFESDTTADQLYALRFAASSYQAKMLPAATMGGTFNHPWAFQLQVASNPAGSQVNLFGLVPASYRVGVQQPWVMFVHGAGPTGNSIYSGNDNLLMDALVNAGYLVISSDRSVNQDWGDPASTQDLASAVNAAQSYFSLAARPYVVAESMGGLVTINSIAKGTINPKAIVGLYPVFNLAGMYGAGSGYGTGDYAPQIQTAYGFSSPSGYAAATVGFDPSLDPASTFAFIPFDVWCSPSDTLVQCSTNGQTLVSVVNGAGGSATYNASTGQHGDASNFNPAAVVAFFGTH